MEECHEVDYNMPYLTGLDVYKMLKSYGIEIPSISKKEIDNRPSFWWLRAAHQYPKLKIQCEISPAIPLAYRHVFTTLDSRLLSINNAV